jgi:hypothetical protein
MTIQEARNIINEITYKNFYFKIQEDIYRGITLVATAPVKDACSGYSFEMAPIIPIKTIQIFDERYFNILDKEQFIKILYITCKRLELHELDEHFKVNGICYVDPHPELKKTS